MRRALAAGALSSAPSLAAAERGFRSQGRLGAEISLGSHGHLERRGNEIEDHDGRA